MLLKLRWFLEYLFLLGIIKALSIFSLEAHIKTGRCLGWVLYHCSAGMRDMVMSNLRIIATSTRAQVAPDYRSSLENFQRTLGNFFATLKTAQISSEELLSRVEFVGLDLLKNKPSKGGYLVLLPHMGHWELLAQISPLIMPEGLSTAAMYRPVNNPYLNAWVKRTREDKGVRLFSAKSELRLAMRFLETGGIMAVLADQKGPSKQDACSFFGRLTNCMNLPERIIKKSHPEKVLVVSCETTAIGYWRVTLEEVNHKPQLELTTADLTLAMEQAHAKSPLDGFWLHDRWKLPTRRALLMRHQQKPVAYQDELLAQLSPLRVIFAVDSSHVQKPLNQEFWDKLTKERPELSVQVILPTPADIKLWQSQLTTDIRYISPTESSNSDKANYSSCLINLDTEQVNPIALIIYLTDDSLYNHLKKVLPARAHLIAKNLDKENRESALLKQLF